jgi:hypothetical protein
MSYISAKYGHVKNLVTRAVWLLPLSAVLGLIDYLLMRNTFNVAENFKFIDANSHHVPLVVIHVKNAILSILEALTFFAGITALVFYIIEGSKFKPARLVLPFLFIATCMVCWHPAIRIFTFIFERNSDISQMFGNYGSIPIGYIGTIAGFCCFMLLFYSMYRSKLFPNWMIILFAIAYFYRLAMWMNFGFSFTESFQIIREVLFIVAYYFVARHVNVPHREPSTIQN